MSSARPNSPDFDQWRKDLVSQAIEHRHAVWSIGDLLLEGEEKFGADRVWSAAEATGMTFDTLRNYKSLANCFPKGKRRLNLGVSHHEAVRSLDEAAREAALDLVQKHDVSRESLRERVKAYNGGDLAALNPDWKPAPKVVDVEDDHAPRDIDEDKPVFDASDAGEAMAAERREAFAEQDLNDANQVLLDALSAVERATAYKNMVHINRDRVNMKRVLSSIVALEQLLPSAQRYHSAGAQPSQPMADKGRAHPPVAPAPAPISSPEDSADDGSHPSIPSSDDVASGPLTSMSAQSEHEPGGEKPSPSPPSAPSYEEDPDLPPFLDRRHG